MINFFHKCGYPSTAVTDVARHCIDNEYYPWSSFATICLIGKRSRSTQAGSDYITVPSLLRSPWLLRTILISYKPIIPHVTFRCDSNIRDQLVHSTLHSNELPFGSTIAWKGSRCKTCVHVISMKSITRPDNNQRNIHDDFTRRSRNLG